MPGDDLVAPSAQGPAELTDLARTGDIAQIGRQLVDPLAGKRGVVMSVDLPDGLLSCQAVAT